MQQIFFISDLHLSELQPEITAKLKTLLKKIPAGASLYILGDLFEIWLGDDEQTPFQIEIAALLKSATLRFNIYFLPGNRDFLLGQKYCAQSGMQYLIEPTVIAINNTPTLLLHGDGLCTHDRLFMLFRAITRHRLFIMLFNKLPLNLRKKIGYGMRNKSKVANQKKSQELMDINFESLKKIMQRYQVQQVIYGHTHRPALFYFDLNQTSKQVFVLSDWHDAGHVLAFSETDYYSYYF